MKPTTHLFAFFPGRPRRLDLGLYTSLYICFLNTNAGYPRHLETTLISLGEVDLLRLCGVEIVSIETHHILVLSYRKLYEKIECSFIVNHEFQRLDHLDNHSPHCTPVRFARVNAS